MILSDTSRFTANTDKFVHQIFYKYTHLLFSHRLLALFPLQANEALVNPLHTTFGKTFFSPLLDYKAVYYKFFYESPAYRDFLFDYIRFSNQNTAISYFNEADAGSFKSSRTNDMATFSPTWDNYYNGLIYLKNLPIRDWYSAKVIMDAFEHYSFEEAEAAMNDFFSKCKTQKYKDALTNYYVSIKFLKAGNKAPGFTLKNEAGKLVSLNDFKGKLVYIDFWGVGCGPCIYDIKNYIPKLHEHYHGKDVVFINICVDVNETSWKRFLTNNKLGGVNLLAEGWTENKVCKDYNINAIPNYVLIDKQGKIVDINTQKPSELLLNQNNSIDKILK